MSVLQIQKTILANLGYTIFEFSDSKKAVEAFQKDPNNIDIVITDYTMPHITGFELAKKIRDIRHDIPIIMCTGYLDKKIAHEIKDIGINEVLKKPISRQSLATSVRRVLNENV